jgi:hypothetical protein
MALATAAAFNNALGSWADVAAGSMGPWEWGGVCG